MCFYTWSCILATPKLRDGRLANNTQRIYLLVDFANLMIAERSGVIA